MKIKLSNVRIAFPALFEAKAVNNGDPVFSAAFVIEPDSANAKALTDAVIATAKEKWKDQHAGVLKKLKEENRLCYKTKPLTNGEGTVYQGFEDKHSLNASNKVRPLVVDRDKSPLTAGDGRPYGGCYVNATVELWAQDNKYGRRVNATLLGVQFHADGDAFGATRVGSADDFEDLGTEAGEESLV